MAYIVNGETIPDELIEEEFESIKEHYQNLGEVVCCDRDEEFWGYARENVVNRALMAQESIRRFGKVGDAEVEARLEEIKAEHGGEKQFFENTGFNPGDESAIRRRLRDSLVVDRLLEAELGEEREPGEEELRAYHEENIDRYLTPERVRVSQLFIEPESHQSAREDYRKLRALRGELLAGADFAETAEKHGSRDKGQIDLGFLAQGESMPEIEAIVFSMEEGEISPVVATHFGFHIFQVTGREEPRPIPVEDLPQLAEQWKAETREKAVNAILDRLKAEGEIEEAAAPETHEPVEKPGNNPVKNS